MRIGCITSVFVALVLIVLSTWFYNTYFSTTSYITKTTGINLPKGTETIETIDNWEFVCIGYYSIQNEQIGSFIKENHLSKSAGSNTALSFDEYLKLDNRSANTEMSQCVFLDSCNNGNHWHVILNTTSGELWIEVTYPDMSGDAPPCETD